MLLIVSEIYISFCLLLAKFTMLDAVYLIFSSIIHVQVEQLLSQTPDSFNVSKNDALAKVMGSDHSGYVRGLGVGALHTVAFRSTMQSSGTSFSSSEYAQLK